MSKWTQVSYEEFEEIMNKYGWWRDIAWINNIVKDLTKWMLETALNAELEYNLWYSKYSKTGNNSWNSRNWYSKKMVKTNDWLMELSVPRDRNGEFEPEIVWKRSNDISNIEQKIINMYWLWLSTQDISNHVKDIYWIGLSESKISMITDKILKDVEEWKNRPLEKVYPIIYLDCIHYKVRQDWKIINKACYIIIWINLEWRKEVLSLVVWENEWAKFWLQVVNNLKSRWVEDIFIACIDWLKWFPEAIRTVYPKVEIQLCIIHQIRTSTKYVSRKDLKEFMKALKTVYKANTEEDALNNLEKMENDWWKTYWYVFKSWKDKWSELSTMFCYPEEIRRLIYTTNTIEWFNRCLRKYTKTKIIFPTDKALEKSLYLAMLNVTKKWTWKISNWWKIYSQLQIFFEDRI